MENDFCQISIRRFVSLINYIESVFYSLETHCVLISDRLNSLNNRIFCSQIHTINLDYKKEFHKFENFSIRDFMLLDDTSIIKNSYFVTLQDCEKILVLLTENFPKFFNCSSTILDKPKLFNERAVDVNMESSQSKSYEQLFQCHKKEDIRIKSKKAASSKNKKLNSFKSSLEKLLRLKSRSEKSLKHDDLRLAMIPQTIYLSPQQTVSLSRDTWCIPSDHHPPPPLHPPALKSSSIRHSCSDFMCRRSSTFCIVDDIAAGKLRTIDRASSPPVTVFYPVAEEEFRSEKIVSSVSHSTSMPAHLSKSHQNVSKSNRSDADSGRPAAKRTAARKKGLFNCSLFRKRSNSHSKSAEKVSEMKSQKSRDLQSKSLNRSENNISGIISDRCLTLPNLKSSDVDLSENVKQHQLLSMDLIKDFINRSNNSLHSTVNRNSMDCVGINHPQLCSVSVHSSPHSSGNCKCDSTKFRTSKMGLCDSMILENPSLYGSFYAQQSASNEPSHSLSQRTTSPLTIDSSALDNNSYRYSNVTPTMTENQKAPCLRQISAPICYQTPQSSNNNQYLSSPPPNSAFEFWTRPYHEKMKASRRRLLDDKVGSKEALLRSLSPHNVKIRDDNNSLYDNPYHHLHIIPEPPTTTTTMDTPSSHSPSICHSRSFYGGVQNRDYRPHSSASPVIENRLLESPASKRQELSSQLMGADGGLLYSTDVVTGGDGSNNSISITGGNSKSPKETNHRAGTEKIYELERKDFSGSFPEIKDMKSFNSSAELILTRTPTPPHSFAESTGSSIYPVPNEFITDQQHRSLTHHHIHKPRSNINLLYTSDNSDDGNDEFDRLDLEPIPPIPPPRTDSVMRSLQQTQQNADADKSEQEYDISDEFPPVFSGANIDRCDIEQYHKWLEKLPYKISEFPNVIQCRKSTIATGKVFPLTENVDSIGKKLDLSGLQELKLSRKSIKSWTTSECSKPSDSVSIKSHGTSSQDSHSLKKSFSYDQCLNNPEMEPITENSPTTQSPIIDSTLLKQYSHLYSLKPSPGQTSKLPDLELSSTSSSSVLKFNRSKSIDLRNFVVNNISGSRMSEKGLENFAQKRKSVPNQKFSSTTNEIISGKRNGNLDIATGNDIGPEYKVYPML